MAPTTSAELHLQAPEKKTAHPVAPNGDFRFLVYCEYSPIYFVHRRQMTIK